MIKLWMKNKINLIALAVTIVAIVLSCMSFGKGLSAPEKSLGAFLEAGTKLNTTKMYELSTIQDQVSKEEWKLMTQNKEALGLYMMDISDYQYDEVLYGAVTYEGEEKDRAKVPYCLLYKGEEVDSGTATMVKRNGKWVVSL